MGSFSILLHKKQSVGGIHQNYLGETILMNTHNICLNGEIRNGFPKLSLDTHLICVNGNIDIHIAYMKISS